MYKVTARAVVAGAAIVAIAAGLYYATRAEGSSKNTRKGPPPAPVIVAQAEAADVSVVLTAIGTVQARASVAVKSRVDGHILETHFREGQTVAKGDLLIRIDPRPFAAQLNQAEANVARDRAQLAKVRADLRRYGALSERGVASVQKLEEAQAAASSLEATIRAGEAAIEFARLQLEYSAIHSPIDGRAGSLLVSAGNLVRGTDAAPLVIINETRPVYVSFTLPEQHLGEIRRRMNQDGLTIEAHPPEDPGPPATGKVDFVNNAVDPATGSIGLRATVANENERLLPGQFANVRVTMDTLRGAIVVPAQAIQNSQKGQFVFVLKAGSIKDNQGEVEQRYVKTGVMHDDRVVVREGLAAGETVVTEGQLRLQPGSRVAIRPAQTS
jgi:multidrug efflux system membrane fusion protein